MTELDIYIDGASKGNPGPSGIGAVICRNGETIKNLSVYIGETTNNVAEYTALIYALKAAIDLKAQTIKVNSDSQLLCRQLKKTYKVKSANIIGLYHQATKMLSGFKHVVINNIPREENSGADKLASKAVKEQLEKQGL